MPAISLCISFAARLLPLENIFGLVHPSVASPPPEDKRTWREGMRRPQSSQTQEKPWTAMDVMTAYAQKRGWVTAKAGRPDVNRAGNASKRTPLASVSPHIMTCFSLAPSCGGEDKVGVLAP